MSDDVQHPETGDAHGREKWISMDTVRFTVGLALLVAAQPIFVAILLIAESQVLGVAAGVCAMLAWLLMVGHVAGVRLI